MRRWCDGSPSDSSRSVSFSSVPTRGTARPDSDVDLLVVLPANGSKRKAAVEMYRLLAGMGIPKDIVVVTPQELEKYRNVAGTIIQPALREGKVLYERTAWWSVNLEMLDDPV